MSADCRTVGWRFPTALWNISGPVAAKKYEARSGCERSTRSSVAGRALEYRAAPCLSCVGLPND